MAVTTTHNTYGFPLNLSTKRVIVAKYKKKTGLVYPLVGAFSTITGGTLQKKYESGRIFQ